MLAACCLLLSAASAAGQNGATVRTTVFHGVELPYVVVGDLALHGDIILGTAEEAAAHAPGARRHDSAVSPRSLAPYPREVLWLQGVVPYVIDADVPHPEWIREAIAIWNRETIIRFVERTTERDYLRFAVRDAGCFGVFGRGFDGGERIMPVEPRGCPVPITLHELGHAIGMWHEQQRKDRDRWLTVFRENINPGDWGRGSWHPHPLAGPDIGPYDYRSVMHYAFFSDDQRRHGEIVMADTIPPGMPFGNTWELSPGDIDAVARLYGHVPSEHVISTNPAGLEIVVDGQQMTAPARFRWGPGSEHTLEVPSPQFRDGARFLFGRWSDDGARAHTITATRETTLYQASFIAQHRVTTTALPAGAGSVRVRPETPDGYYTLRTPVDVSASPNPGFRFLAWETHSDFWWSWFTNRSHGDSSNPARTLVADGLTYRARFTEGPMFRIESNVDPVEVAIGDRRLTAPVSLLPEWFSGTTTVDANMDPRPRRRSFRHRFRSWSDGGDAEHTVAVPADEDTTLRLTLDTEYRLETRAWYGHEIETIPASDDGFYPLGAQVRLRAVDRPPEEKFIGWSGGDVFGADPTARVTMDTGRYVEAVFAAGTSEILSGEPVGVSLRWGAEPGHDRRYVRVPPGAEEIEIRFSTTSSTEGAEAGLFVTHRRDPWPWDVEHADADRILRGGVETVTVSPAADGWPAAYFILVRPAAAARGEQKLEGTLVATVTRDRRGNRAPVAVGTLRSRSLALDSTLEVNLSRAFMDPDGDPLTYAVASSEPDILTVRVLNAGAVLTAVSAGAATIQVTATDPGGLSTTQAFAVTVEATVRAPFTDDPLVPGVTPIKAIHFTELRARIDARRRAAGLVPFRWTDPNLHAGVTRVRLVHLSELRSALVEAYAAAGRVAPDWIDAAPAAGRTPLRAAHVMELRAAVAALE